MRTTTRARRHAVLLLAFALLLFSTPTVSMQAAPPESFEEQVARLLRQSPAVRHAGGATLPKTAPIHAHRASEAVAKRPLHSSLSATCTARRDEIIYVDADFPGNDMIELGSFDEANLALLKRGATEGDLVQHCCEKCAAEPRCKAWSMRQSTYESASCSLKTRPVHHVSPPRRPYSGVIS